MKTKNVEIYYVFRCDDKNRPNDMSCDEYFDLSCYQKVKELKEKLDSLSINYDLLIERFDITNHEILSNDYIVDNNCINN